MSSIMNILLASLVWASLPGYAAQLETWTDLAKIPTGTLREHTAVALSSTQVVTLGGVVTGGQPGQTTNLVQVYNIPGNSWTKVAPMPVVLNHVNAAAVDGKIYVLGGFTQTTQSYSWKATTSAAVYDPKADKWDTLPEMPATLAPAKGASAVGVYNKTIYIAGGKAGSGTKSVDNVVAFNVPSGQWMTLPEAASKIPGPRDHVGGAVVGHRFYVLGGRDTDIPNVKDTVFILDLEAPEKGWTTSPAKMPTARGGLAVAAIGSKIYTFGGEGNKASAAGVFNQTEVYDTEADAWTSLGPMKTPRHGTCAVVVEGKIYIAGGGTSSGGGDTNVVDSFTP